MGAGGAGGAGGRGGGRVLLFAGAREAAGGRAEAALAVPLGGGETLREALERAVPGLGAALPGCALALNMVRLAHPSPPTRSPAPPPRARRCAPPPPSPGPPPAPPPGQVPAYHRGLTGPVARRST